MNFNRRDWVVLLLALLLAFSTWLIHNLALRYNDYLKVSVTAVCNIDGHYNVDTPEYNTIYTQFMAMLEQTVEELTKCFLLQYGDNKELSYGRCKTMKSFNELYDGLRALK